MYLKQTNKTREIPLPRMIISKRQLIAELRDKGFSARIRMLSSKTIPSMLKPYYKDWGYLTVKNNASKIGRETVFFFYDPRGIIREYSVMASKKRDTEPAYYLIDFGTKRYKSSGATVVSGNTYLK